MSYSENIKVKNITNDAFGLQEVAAPQTLFDAQLTYDLQPLLYEQINNGDGTITHDTTNRCANISINAVSGANSSYMQTYEYFRYQPGKGQKVFITFNFRSLPPIGYVKFAQYGDSTNSFRLELDSNGDLYVKLITATDEGNQSQLVAPSGFDYTKEQILVIEFEALYVGTAKFSLQLGNAMTLLHQFENANNSDYPYIQTANLPVRVGIEGTGVINTDMFFNCCSVQSSGGQDDTSGYPFSAEGVTTALNAQRINVLSVRPKLTFNSLENRVKFILESVDFIVTGNNPVKFEIAVGRPTANAVWSDVNTEFSAFEVDTTSSGNGTQNPIFFEGVYLDSSNQQKGTANTRVPMRLPITLDAAGLNREYGVIAIIATGLGGTSACRAKLNWKEIR